MNAEDPKMSLQELWTHPQTQSTSIKHDLRFRYYKIRSPQSCLSKYCELGLPTCPGRLSHKIRWPSGGVFEPGLVNTPIKVNRPNLATNKAIQATLFEEIYQNIFNHLHSMLISLHYLFQLLQDLFKQSKFTSDPLYCIHPATFTFLNSLKLSIKYLSLPFLTRLKGKLFQQLLQCKFISCFYNNSNSKNTTLMV